MDEPDARKRRLTLARGPTERQRDAPATSARRAARLAAARAGARPCARCAVNLCSCAACASAAARLEHRLAIRMARRAPARGARRLGPGADACRARAARARGRARRGRGPRHRARRVPRVRELLRARSSRCCRARRQGLALRGRVRRRHARSTAARRTPSLVRAAAPTSPPPRARRWRRAAAATPRARAAARAAAMERPRRARLEGLGSDVVADASCPRPRGIPRVLRCAHVLRDAARLPAATSVHRRAEPRSDPRNASIRSARPCRVPRWIERRRAVPPVDRRRAPPRARPAAFLSARSARALRRAPTRGAALGARGARRADVQFAGATRRYPSEIDDDAHRGPARGSSTATCGRVVARCVDTDDGAAEVKNDWCNGDGEIFNVSGCSTATSFGACVMDALGGGGARRRLIRPRAPAAAARPPRFAPRSRQRPIRPRVRARRTLGSRRSQLHQYPDGAIYGRASRARA